MVVLGIDAGTTNIKAVLADESGRQLDLVSAPTQVLMPFEGACEMDMQALWQQLCALTLQLQQRNPQLWQQLAGVGITAQGDGMWPLDKQGNPCGNAILWNDTRAGTIPGVDWAQIDNMLEKNASTALFSGAFPVILKWLQLHEPKRYGEIGTVLHCKDWLNYKLTGNIVSDYTDFSTAGTNIFTNTHLLQLYDMLEIPQVKKMLPTLLPSTGVAGIVTKQAGDQSGIPVGVPVITGCIDVAATALGSGVIHAGDGCTILGTTLCNEILITPDQVDTANRSGSALCSIFPGKYIRVMAALSGNSTIDWAKSILCSELSFAQLEQQLEQVPPGSRGIVYHPYIAGERAPFRQPFACAGFNGLNARHNRMDMMRAVYEGMVLSIKDCFAALPQTEGKLYLSGGGAVSNFTCQLIASALNKEVIRPNHKEIAARGIVKAICIGLDLTIDSSGQNPGDLEDSFYPIPQQTQVFEQLYSQFTNLKDSLQPYWIERQAMV